MEEMIVDTNKRIDALEANNTEIKSMMEFVVEQIKLSNESSADEKSVSKKLDKMEKQLQQLLSYVDEE